MVQSVGYNQNLYNAYNNQATNKEKQRRVDDSMSVLGLALASEGIHVASNQLARALMRGKEYTTPQNIIDVTQNMLRQNNLDTKVFFVDPSNIYDVSRATRISVNELRDVANGKNAFFSDSHRVAVAPVSKPSLIQHELGHAINSKKAFTRFLQNSRRLAVFAPTALILANKINEKINDNPEKETFIERNAGKLGFLAFLPTIIEEGLASIRGIQAAKSTLGGQNVKLGPLRKNYLLAWLTYVLAGVGLGIASKISVKTGIPS